jgi:hypothetical protein
MNDKAVAFAEANVARGSSLRSGCCSKRPAEMGAVYQSYLKEQMEKMNRAVSRARKCDEPAAGG